MYWNAEWGVLNGGIMGDYYFNFFILRNRTHFHVLIVHVHHNLVVKFKEICFPFLQNSLSKRLTWVWKVLITKRVHLKRCLSLNFSYLIPFAFYNHVLCGRETCKKESYVISIYKQNYDKDEDIWTISSIFFFGYNQFKYF